MDDMKDKYFMRAFLSGLAFAAIFVCIFFSIYDDMSMFIIIPLVALDLIILFICYQSIVYRLSLRSKNEVIVDMKLNINDLMEHKLESKKKSSKIIDKLFTISLFACPVLMILAIGVGIFIANSVLLSLVLPALLTTYLLVLFFLKDFFNNYNLIEEKEIKEAFVINKKAIIYMGRVYLINGCGFYLRDSSYKFLFLPLAKISFRDEAKEKIEGALSEASSK